MICGSYVTGGNNLLVQIHLLIDELSALPINDRCSMITIQTDKATVAGVTRLKFAVLTVSDLRKLRYRR